MHLYCCVSYLCPCNQLFQLKIECLRLFLLIAKFFKTISRCVWCVNINIARYFSRTKIRIVFEKNFKIKKDPTKNLVDDEFIFVFCFLLFKQLKITIFKTISIQLCCNQIGRQAVKRSFLGYYPFLMQVFISLAKNVAKHIKFPSQFFQLSRF